MFLNQQAHSLLGNWQDTDRILRFRFTYRQFSFNPIYFVMGTVLFSISRSVQISARGSPRRRPVVSSRYSEIPELTSEILRIFIKRAEVGERAEKYSRTVPQEVRIYYRDIGLVDELPQSTAEATAKDIPDEVA